MKEKPATVFVVDDDDAVRTSLRLLLKSVGLPVETFGSAQEFLTRSTRTVPAASSSTSACPA
jgi:FixJ family two-component response regulator